MSKFYSQFKFKLKCSNVTNILSANSTNPVGRFEQFVHQYRAEADCKNPLDYQRLY